MHTVHERLGEQKDNAELAVQCNFIKTASSDRLVFIIWASFRLLTVVGDTNLTLHNQVIPRHVIIAVILHYITRLFTAISSLRYRVVE